MSQTPARKYHKPIHIFDSKLFNVTNFLAAVFIYYRILILSFIKFTIEGENMRSKFSLALALSVIVLSIFGVQAQTYWEYSDKKSDKQTRQKTSVRTIGRQNSIIIVTPDQVVVRPAVRSNIRPVIARSVAPRPQMSIVRSKAEVSGNNYSSNRNASSFSNRRYESNGDDKSGRGYESKRYGSGVAEVARLNGYRDGLREGARDASDGDAYNPFGEHAYKDGATGYISKYGNRGAYQRLYRQSFMRGYKESFDRYLGNYERRNW